MPSAQEVFGSIARPSADDLRRAASPAPAASVQHSGATPARAKTGGTRAAERHAAPQTATAAETASGRPFDAANAANVGGLDDGGFVQPVASGAPAGDDPPQQSK